MCQFRSPFNAVRLLAALFVLTLIATASRAEKPSAGDVRAAVQKEIKDGRLVLLPHDFNDIGFLQGGLRRTDSEMRSEGAVAILVDTICLLEARTTGLDRKAADKLGKKLSADIEPIIQAELDLIAKNEGKPEDLLDKLHEQHEKAYAAFSVAAKELGYVARFEGDKRWTIDFETKPEGASVFFINAGDYDLYEYCKKKGLIANEPSWIPAGDREKFGDKCQYKVYAKWKDGKTSELKDLTVTKSDTVTLVPKKP